jgi:uncharacterized glyoxalase superfamily protein PhnB
VLTYDDVAQASDWLCSAFGFRERLRIGDHRAQLVFGDGAVILTARDARGTGAVAPRLHTALHAVHVRVEDADRHHERTKQRGARILEAPTDYPYGERQYSALDLGGHLWTFSESIADVDPATWGATSTNVE